MRLPLAILLVLLVWARPAAAAERCALCLLPDGVYHVAAPPGWDGHSRLKLFVYLHGWRQKGTDATGDPNIAGVANRLGYLLVAPDGALGPHGSGWGHVGSPERVRDDQAFVLEVLRDVERRWPIDMGAVVLGGFSQGASMVWDMACYRARYFTAFIPFSGGFWQPMPPACTSGPVALRHTHGTHDHMVPLEGRAILEGRYRQADIFQGFLRWQAEDRCTAAPDLVHAPGALDCKSWTQCGAGQLQLCLHDGDHSMIAPWLEASLKWAMGVKGVAAEP